MAVMRAYFINEIKAVAKAAALFVEKNLISEDIF